MLMAFDLVGCTQSGSLIELVQPTLARVPRYIASFPKSVNELRPHFADESHAFALAEPSGRLCAIAA